MATASNSRVLRIIPLLIAVFLFSFPAQAQYGGGNNTMASAETSTYVFLSDQSTVVKTGGIAGVHETYPIQGQFQLTVDASAGVASFDYVDAFLLSPISSSPPQSLGELFNMTELQGTAVNDALIEFRGKTADNTNTDIALTLTFTDAAVQLTGQTIPGWTDFFIFNVDAVAQRKYGGGIGEPNSPYLIYIAEQMNEIGADANDWDKHFKLMADIDLSSFTGTDFNIIGYYVSWDSLDNKPFAGVFDGNGKKISNFSYTSTDRDYVGLFGYVGKWEKHVVIRDLGLIDPNVDAGTGDYVGSLVGRLLDGTITGCYVEGGSVSGNNRVGGLVGLNFKGTITYCYSAAAVTGDCFVGGLVGWNGRTIRNCSSTGSVSGNGEVGGLVGMNYRGGTITGCFWDIETSGQVTSDGGTGKTTAEMQMESTFTDAGWDFVGESENGTEDIWSICEGTNYPRLVWQIPVGDFVCPDGITIDDFVFFAEYWRDDNCDLSNDYCEGTDLDFSGTVDEADLEILVENWLAGVRSD